MTADHEELHGDIAEYQTSDPIPEVSSDPSVRPHGSIIDNRDGNTLLARLERATVGGRELSIASAFFSLEGLAMLGPTLANYERIRILFGDDASARERQSLLALLRDRSDAELLQRRATEPTLAALRPAAELFARGRVEARCYTERKFHAKAYLITRPDLYPSELGILGSGNFTRPGLTQNIELNTELTLEQTAQLHAWYEERWAEAEHEVVTDALYGEILRQIELYDPYLLYLKALLAWGSQQVAPALSEPSEIVQALDPHQEHGFRRVLKLIESHHGCMLCDGVGLGKSYIALAVMERYCREGRNVLLIAPKSILDASWSYYLSTYLDEYLDGWGGIRAIATTELGFVSEEKAAKQRSAESPNVRKRWADLRRWSRSADLVIVDESHNFRTQAANRYGNLLRLLRPHQSRRKNILLLSATPINTSYIDLANQLALIAGDSGRVAGWSAPQLRKLAAGLDDRSSQRGNLTMASLQLSSTPDQHLNRVLETVLIQRSRKTVEGLARSVGKEVRFPTRNDPRTLEIVIGDEHPAYRDLIDLARRLFEPTASYISDLQAKRKNRRNRSYSRRQPSAQKGIKFAAYLTEQYRRTPERAEKAEHDEAYLAGLVFVNALKQLESSPAAFQGILQSLGLGLLARLRHVFGDETRTVSEEHQEWIRMPIEPTVAAVDPNGDNDTAESEDLDEIQISGGSLDASGDETDAWLTDAVRSRALGRKLAAFQEPEYDTSRWRADIEDDLQLLREIHTATIKARRNPDPKLLQVVKAIREIVDRGQRLLIFTQSRRTAEYLERELREQLISEAVARIDSHVVHARQAIIHAFCPNYNPRPDPWPPSVPERLDILISTDVLSEGVNLQDADVILSYDIHWNPVRLIQRIGRVDRRIDPERTPPDHRFDIINVLPPEEIDGIIGLVSSVEDRTIKISRTLGLDVSFFKTTDPAGNLKEFNAQADGDTSPLEEAHNTYARLIAHPLPEEHAAAVERIPPGAFGAWAEAPEDGVFAMFTLQADDTRESLDRFEDLIGKVILAAYLDGEGITTDPGAILTILSRTVPNVRSALPTDETRLSRILASIRDHIRSEYASREMPGIIRLRLECWMEWRKS